MRGGGGGIFVIGRVEEGGGCNNLIKEGSFKQKCKQLKNHRNGRLQKSKVQKIINDVCYKV